MSQATKKVEIKPLAGRPSSKELGALLQDSLYEATGFHATYAGERLESLAAMTHRSHLAFHGRRNGIWRILWENSLESLLRSNDPGQAPRQLMVDMLYKILRRWSVRQPDLGPLMVGDINSEDPEWIANSPNRASAALNVDTHLVEISLFYQD